MANAVPLGWESIAVGYQLTGDTTISNPYVKDISSTANLRVGMTVSGTGITAGSVIDVIGIQMTGDTTVDEATVTSIADTSDLSAGMTVSGTGIPAATTINTVDSGTQITLSANATATSTGVLLTFASGTTFTLDQNATATGNDVTLTFYGQCWLTTPRGASVAIIQNSGNDIRWRDDGTEPTLTDGMMLADGGYLTYDGNLNTIRFYQADSATVSALQVTYYDDFTGRSIF